MSQVPNHVSFALARAQAAAAAAVEANQALVAAAEDASMPQALTSGNDTFADAAKACVDNLGEGDVVLLRLYALRRLRALQACRKTFSTKQLQAQRYYDRHRRRLLANSAEYQKKRASHKDVDVVVVNADDAAPPSGKAARGNAAEALLLLAGGVPAPPPLAEARATPPHLPQRIVTRKMGLRSRNVVVGRRGAPKRINTMALRSRRVAVLSSRPTKAAASQ